jgi:hypothetical protein
MTADVASASRLTDSVRRTVLACPEDAADVNDRLRVRLVRPGQHGQMKYPTTSPSMKTRSPTEIPITIGTKLKATSDDALKAVDDVTRSVAAGSGQQNLSVPSPQQ